MAEADRRIPSLDGIRGILLIVVLSAHTLGTRGFPISREALPMEGFAYTAMRIFFIISGFLITGILLGELKRRGSINLLRFYFKRTFRIFPAYYLFLGVVAACVALGWMQLRPGDMAHALTYTSNYNADRAWHVGHTWSLSVEEQFYLLWPAMLLMLGLRRAVWALGAMVLVLPFWRVALQALPPNAFGLGIFQAGIGHTYDTTADIIAIGCLLAILRHELWDNRFYRGLVESRAVKAVALFWILMVPLTPELAYRLEGNARYGVFTAYELIGIPFVNIAIALLLDWAMRNPATRVGKVLNKPLLMTLGVISYSTYLWQQVFLNRHQQDTFINAFPQNVILALALGWLSFKFIEHPGLAVREWLDAKFRKRPLEMPAAQPQLPLVAEAQGAPTT
jgi:peptidoglycan/LPS O-acetylase OafA/YrhL